MLTQLVLARRLALPAASADGDLFDPSMLAIAVIGLTAHDIADDVGVTVGTVCRYLLELKGLGHVIDGHGGKFILPRAPGPAPANPPEAP